MPLVDRNALVAELGKTVDMLLSSQLVDEYMSLEHRFVLRDWEPAQLDGGQFCEIGARIVYVADSGNTNLNKGLDDSLKYIENDQVRHSMAPRHDALHLAKVLRCVYKFRSQRGAVHISPTYSPNAMDAKFIMEGVRWCFAELLRVFWAGDREAVAKSIRELLQFDTPAIGSFGERLLVQRTDVTAEEEVLLLLHHAGEAGMTRTDIGRHAEFGASTISEALKRLVGRGQRQVIQVGAQYRLTDLGCKRVREGLSEKLRLG